MKWVLSFRHGLWVLAGTLLLSACGGGDSSAGAPVITAQPANVAIQAGQVATFGVEVAGTPPLSFQWQRGGSDVAGATSATLTLPATALSDDGAQFRVRVANSAGSVLSEIATLTVAPTPVGPSITLQPVAASVLPGQAASFAADATGSEPLIFQWRLDGIDIAGATRRTYTVSAPLLADDGAVYSVRVTNEAGSVLSAGVRLSVTAAPIAPSIAVPPAPATVTTGASARFDVTATGTAPLSYQWQRDGAAIPGASLSSYVTPATLGSDNASRYSVVVTNAAGSAVSTEAVLTVTALPVAPTITSPPAALRVTEGQAASFTVSATGSAPLAYQWLKNGIAVPGANAPSYTTPAATLADNLAAFSVRITNDAGAVVSANAVLTVDALAARLPAGTTDRFLPAFSAAAGQTTSDLRLGEYVVDAFDPTRSAAYTPLPTNATPARNVHGGTVDTANQVIRNFGARHHVYTQGASALHRLDLDRAPALPTVAALVGPDLGICSVPYRHLGSSASGDSVVYAYIANQPICAPSAPDAGVYYGIDVGTAGTGVPFRLPGAPINVTRDDQGNIDGYLLWSPTGSLLFYDRRTDVTTTVTAPHGLPGANSGIFSASADSPLGNSIRTRGGILLYNDGVWRFDKATKTLSGLLWRQSSNFYTSKVAVYTDAVLVASTELFIAANGNASTGDATLWRVDDDAGARVTVLAHGPALNLDSLRFTRDYVLLQDPRAEHVAVSRVDGSVRWTGPSQLNVDTVVTSLLSNTVAFAGKPIGQADQLVSLNLDTLSRPPPLVMQYAGTALSDVVPLHSRVEDRLAAMPISHLLAWRPAAGKTDLARADLVWVDMATAEVVSVSGTLPDAAYTSFYGQIGLVVGHAGVLQMGLSTAGSTTPPTTFVFSVAVGSLKPFTPPH